MTGRLQGVHADINPQTLENETLAFLLNYWNAKRGTRAMPSRADVKASEIREYLGWVMLIEVSPDISSFRYRLMGTLVAQYFQKDGTGLTAEELYAEKDPAVAKSTTAMFRKCARDKVVIRSHGDAGWIGEGFEQFDSICVPLSDDGETVNMILHAFTFDRSNVLMAREVARANGGELPPMSFRTPT